MFFVEKLLTRQKIRPYVTLGNMLPMGKTLYRQNVSRQLVTRQNVTRQNRTWQKVPEHLFHFFLVTSVLLQITHVLELYSNVQCTTGQYKMGVSGRMFW